MLQGSPVSAATVLANNHFTNEHLCERADIFVKAMHKAAADAIRNIRLGQSTSQSDVAMH
jgi:hypothetical protein